MKPLLLAFCLVAIPALAQDPPSAAEDPLHGQLRATRAAIIDAIESRDIERMLGHAHPDIVVTWQNGEVCHGIAELRAFYDRMGKDTFIAFKVPHEADHLSILHGGDAALSAGHVVGDYRLFGKSFVFDSRWTATLVLKEGQWLVAAYHISLNALDNPILDAAKSSLWLAVLVGLVAGLGLALLVVRLRRRR